jgi:hypothetical protein
MWDYEGFIGRARGRPAHRARSYLTFLLASAIVGVGAGLYPTAARVLVPRISS